MVRAKEKQGINTPTVKYAGVRSSTYGIKPFPSPQGWENAMKKMAGYLKGSTPCAIWIVGILERPDGCFLNFPAKGNNFQKIYFGETLFLWMIASNWKI
jgi:hypothetical protein